MMWVDVVVMIETPAADDVQRRVLSAAMERRGWEPAGANRFHASFTHVERDEAVVRKVEQDVKEAVYVAGIVEFDAACLLSDGGPPVARFWVDADGHADSDLSGIEQLSSHNRSSDTVLDLDDSDLNLGLRR